MLEYEKKIMLSEEEYKAIFALAGMNASAKRQVNYYFDTDDFAMNKKKVTYRIREKDGKFKAAIKYHDTKHSDCSVEEDIEEKTAYDPTIFLAQGLQYQGKLITHRIVIYKDACCEMVVDRNTYLGYTDFELEVEYNSGNEPKAQALLQNLAKLLMDLHLLNNTTIFTERVGQMPSKSQRFFEIKMTGDATNEYGFA